MRSLTKLAFVIAVGVTWLPCQPARADLMLFKIRGPQECPDGLTVKSSAGKEGMIEFDVSLEPEGVAHAGELYKGRVNALAILKIATPGQPIASVTLRGAPEGKRTRYQFTMSPSAARASELQLGVSLFEKDGFATVGGGVSLQVFLAGFQPAEKPVEK